MNHLLPALSVLLLAFLPWQGPAPRDQKVESVDFSAKRLPADWRVSSRSWKVEDGELCGSGNGSIEYKRVMEGDFDLSFEAWTEEKANIEVFLFSQGTRKKEDYYGFAFLGSYHPVLDGVKSAILKGNRFVSVDSRMWIFPGRDFRFEVRRNKNRFQMFLNGEAGPAFTDNELEMEKFRFRIVYSGTGKKDEVRIDNIRLVTRK